MKKAGLIQKLEEALADPSEAGIHNSTSALEYALDLVKQLEQTESDDMDIQELKKLQKTIIQNQEKLNMRDSLKSRNEDINHEL